jgi:uncharacterized protein YkwD
MIRQISGLFIAFILVTITLPALPADTLANSPSSRESSDHAFDLVNAVNVLRASNGLAAYGVNSILMYTAQNQAEFMATNGIVTHAGPGGVGLTDRLLAAGYPLAGDLSLGGFRAENITSGSEGMSAQSAVDHWSGDALHLDTMLSPNLTEIGAGVSIANGRVYYVIDAALPNTGQAPQGMTSVVSGGSSIPGNEAPISVVVMSTPNQNGEVTHEVQPGQTLWRIAIEYDVKIDDIKKLNDLIDNNIYPGDMLLIKRVAAVTHTLTVPTTLTPTSKSILTGTSIPALVLSPTMPTPTVSSNVSTNNSKIMLIMVSIIALAILGGGVFLWLGSARQE